MLALASKKYDNTFTQRLCCKQNKTGLNMNTKIENELLKELLKEVSAAKGLDRLGALDNLASVIRDIKNGNDKTILNLAKSYGLVK